MKCFPPETEPDEGSQGAVGDGGHYPDAHLRLSPYYSSRASRWWGLEGLTGVARSRGGLGEGLEGLAGSGGVWRV